MPGDKPYRFHPEALQELEVADDWYAERNLDVSAEFLLSIAEAIENVTDFPQRWPAYLYGTRRLVMQRFPFSVIYLDDPEEVRIVALAHVKRKPGLLETANIVGVF